MKAAGSARAVGVPGAVAGRVSVIVPTKNSARTIAACLSSVRDQSYEDVEVVVVDNGSTDETIAIAADFADVLLTGSPERSAQRNIGAARSTGEFLVFIDSDMRVSPNVMASVALGFQRDPELAALVLPERSIGSGYWARCRALEKEIYIGDPTVEAARAFQRPAFMRLGGYDERIHAGGEDWDLPERLISAGGAIGRVDAHVIHDEGRLTLRDDLAKKLYYGRSFGVYVTGHRNRAVGKFLRLGLLRRPDLLLRDPLHACGLFVLKSLELLALLTGVLVAVFRDHPVAAVRSEAEREPTNAGRAPEPARDR